MRQKQIAMVSHADDLHALAVRDALHKNYGDVVCSFVECDRIANNCDLQWSATRDGSRSSTLPSVDGNAIHPADLDAIWWRRANRPQNLPKDITNPVHIDLINNDSRAALLGILLADFRGRWVCDPEATLRADNKLVQLRAAEAVGIKIPRTIVSQDADEIRRFCSSLENQVIVKTVRGTNLCGTLTRKLPEDEEIPRELISLCPTIYQELVPGKEHVRAHCFGDQIYCVKITTDDLDWRQNLSSPMEQYTLPNKTNQSLLRVMQHLGLRMGVVDLKLHSSGEPVWLEVNPQGQFLFVQALCDLDLIAVFAEFLRDEACAA